MLSSKNRLNKTNDINKVYKEGGRASERVAALFFRRSINKDSIRIAFVVSGKQIPRIVDRNLVKRRMRAQIKKILKNIKPGFDIIISGKKIALTTDQKELSSQLKKLFQKAGVWREND